MNKEEGMDWQATGRVLDYLVFKQGKENIVRLGSNAVRAVICEALSVTLMASGFTRWLFSSSSK